MFYDDLDIPPPVTELFSVSSLPLQSIKAQQQLMLQGKISKHIFWLQEGLVRAVFCDPTGKEFTKEFFWKGDIILQPRSLLTAEPLPYSLLTLEPCLYRQLPCDSYLQYVQQDPLWQRYHMQLLEIHLINKERKEEFLLLNSPEQRVAKFQQMFPWLISRIPDYIVASYLGITPISYSRIKKRLI